MLRILALLWLLLLALLLTGQETEPPMREIRMTAKKYEFSPSEIHVKSGERIRLVITALDRKHGFELKAVEIKTELVKGKETVVEFVAPKAGQYLFNCSVFCGFGHRGMKGWLVVEPCEAAP
jgi:cytochrome c oxidase subunit 2